MKTLLLAAVGLAGLTLSACETYGPPPPNHVERCLARHPGYDPRTNLFPGPDGRLHECRARGW